MKIAAAVLAFFAVSGSYHVARHVAVGGSGGWDYVSIDAVSRHLFVSHSDRVEVIDADSGRAVGSVPASGVHGIALAPELKRGYVSNGRAATVTVFDLATLAKTAEVKTTGENPDAILYDPATKRVFTFNGRGKNATVIDAGTSEVLGTIPIEGKPEFAVSDGAGRLFVNVEDRNEIAVIDSKKMTVTARYPMAKCEAPTGLAFDRAHQRLFSVCEESKTMTVVDAADGKNLASLPIGAGVDGAAFDDERQLAFASNGADGTLTVVREVSPAEFEVAGTVPTARGARTIVLDPKTHHLFLPTARFGPPPAPTPERPHPRPSIVEGSFELLEVAP